jgi:hypothetical protein
VVADDKIQGKTVPEGEEVDGTKYHRLDKGKRERLIGPDGKYSPNKRSGGGRGGGGGSGSGGWWWLTWWWRWQDLFYCHLCISVPGTVSSQAEQ